ncbi:ParA family protein [Actinomadura sp. NPDC047616]|uniref:ParA family protein n=1 Tax=Actinomadura sp. NPDC047616 TaxID=3155914 RepID=UPI0033E06369
MAVAPPWWVVNVLKGGARKSTTAMFLAFALASAGEDDVLVVDADHGTQGVTDWATRVYADGGTLPFHVVQWAPSQGLLVPFAQRAAHEVGARRVLVDVGGEAPEVLRQVILAARLVVAPVGPEQGELSRVPATALIAREARVPLHALLTRVPSPGKGIAKSARDYLTGERLNVLTTEIPQDRETYAHVWGTVPDDLGAYVECAKELCALEGRVS